MDETWTDLEGGAWTDAAGWSPAGPPGPADTARIAGGGTYAVLIGQSETIATLALADPGATVLVSGSAGAASTTLAVAGGITLDGGELELAGGFAIGLGAGGRTYTLDNPATLELSGGVATDPGAPGGTIAGSIAAIDLIGGQTLDHLSLAMGDSVELLSSGGTATLGRDAVLQQIGSLDEIDGAFVNEGLIRFSGAPWARIGGNAASDLANTGTIVTGSEEVLATLDNFANAGLLDIGGAFELNVAETYANTGTIALAADASLDLSADTTLAGLGRIDNAGGRIGIGGTLDLGGGTLAIAPGGTFADLLLTGTLRDGTIVPSGGRLAVQGGTFDGITYDGVLDLGAFGTLTTLDVVDGLSVRGGTVDVTGEGDTLQCLDSETLHGLTLNFGSAAGGDAALLGDPSGTLALGPDAVLNGQGGQMTVAAGAFVNQGRIADAAGALSIAATSLDNAGTFELSGASATVRLQAASLANSGDVAIGAGDTLVLQSVTYQADPASLPAGFTNTGTITMAPGSELMLDTNATLARLGAIRGSGGTLDIAPRQDWFASTTEGVLDLGGGTLAVGGGGPISELIVQGTIENGTVLLLPGGTIDPQTPAIESGVTQQAPCYLSGTRLHTSRGEVAVEALAVGELVTTAAGEAVPIVWIGHRRIDCRRHPRPELVWPVRVREGAFGPGLPKRDLLLSPDHAVSVAGEGGEGDVLIPIKHLVNGLTIAQEPADSVHYFHVELAQHDILLAEGLPAESYLDTGNRGQFANGGAPVALYPDFWSRSWASACAPLRERGPDVDAARRRLLSRAQGLGASAGGGVHLLAGGRAIAPASVKGRLLRFVLPAGTRHVTIVAADAHQGTDAERPLALRFAAVLLNGRIIEASRIGAEAPAGLALPAIPGPLLLELLLRDCEDGAAPSPCAVTSCSVSTAVGGYAYAAGRKLLKQVELKASHGRGSHYGFDREAYPKLDHDAENPRGSRVRHFASL